MSFGHGVTVTRLRATAVDDGYNGTRLDWTTPDELDIPGCGLAPRAEEEQRERSRQGLTEGWTLYCPYDADIAFQDRVVTSQGTYEVEGSLLPWRNPFTGREAGATIHLRVVEG